MYSVLRLSTPWLPQQSKGSSFKGTTAQVTDILAFFTQQLSTSLTLKVKDLSPILISQLVSCYPCSSKNFDICFPAQPHFCLHSSYSSTISKWLWWCHLDDGYNGPNGQGCFTIATEILYLQSCVLAKRQGLEVPFCVPPQTQWKQSQWKVSRKFNDWRKNCHLSDLSPRCSVIFHSLAVHSPGWGLGGLENQTFTNMLSCFWT